MSERFTEILRAASEPAWSDAVRHRFVNELFAGAVPDAVMARYLIQDHRFLDSFFDAARRDARRPSPPHWYWRIRICRNSGSGQERRTQDRGFAKSEHMTPSSVSSALVY